MMNNKLTKILLSLLIVINISAQTKSIVKGFVKDTNKKPVPYANVFIEGTFEGAMTDESGFFEFISSNHGIAILTVSSIGYETYKTELNLKENNKIIELDIVLGEKVIKLKEAVVTASSYSSEKEKGFIISRLDVLTTPGGAADLYQSIKTMPGLTHVYESAELYVRGGDPQETITFINQTPVYHPYTFESMYGGIFSNLKQNAIKSIYFSSGGFSVKYGNMLSGVLDIETKDLPINTGGSMGISLAGFDLSINYSPEKELYGIYANFSQSYTKPIFWLNGGSNKMRVAPISKNFTAGAILKYSSNSKLKLFLLAADDKQGINVERPEFNGVFDGNSSNYLINLQSINFHSKNFIVKTAIGLNEFNNKWKFGVLDIIKIENVLSFRSDAELQLNKKIKISGGIEYENKKVNYTGKIPDYDYNIRPDAKYINIAALIKWNRIGGYGEIQALNFLSVNNLSIACGARFDRIINLNTEWTDPRFSISYKLSEKSTIRFGTGIFRQIPDPGLFNPNDGNPNLKPMHAVHYILSYEYNLDNDNSFRLEIYNKKYNNLPAENKFTNYDNSGFGYARGLDFIYKGIFPYGITGWITYGYIDTKRKWMDYEYLTRSSFDITHNISLVIKFNLSDSYQFGLTAKYATGRPYTPVLNSIYKDELDIYEPIYGVINSSRFPDYKRIDFRLTYFNMLFKKYYLSAYVECINIFDFKNLFGYSYNFDYNQKKEIESYFGRRMFVFGLMVQM